MSKEAFAAVVEMAVSGRTDRLAALLHDAGSAADVRREVATTAEYHLVGPLVGSALSRHPADEALAGHFARAQRDALTRHLRILGDLRWTARVLDGLNVAWAVLKGPFLVEHGYKQPDLRRYGDLDVLVDRRRFGDVLIALESHGATLRDRNWPMIAETQRGELSLVLPGGTLLDLHWHLVVDHDVREGFRIDVDDVLERRRTIVNEGFAMPALSAGDALFHTALHAVLTGGDRLLWMIDLAKLVQADGTPTRDDWARASKFGWHHAGAIAFDAASSVVPSLHETVNLAPASMMRLAHRAVLRRAGLNRALDARFSGRLMVKSTRRSAMATSRAACAVTYDQAIRGLLTNPNHPWRTHRKLIGDADSPARSPLKNERPSDADRARFLDGIRLAS